MGPTGAGKSTIANLILRYHDVTNGTVSISGIDVRKFQLSELRNQVGLVSQDPFLFDATVKENLLLAKPNCTDEEIIHALEVASALDFVNALPKK